MHYLARLDNYPQISAKPRDDLDSAIDLLRGDLQNPVLSDDIMPGWRGCPVKS